MTNPEQLRVLSIGHYVVGGLHALFGSFGLIHVSMGLMMIFGGFGSDSGPNSAPPAIVGYIFAFIGGMFVLFGWILGFLTILSGRYIAQRRNRTFSIVMGAVNCAMVPFGTVIGIFAIVVLTNAEVIKEYPPRIAGQN